MLKEMWKGGTSVEVERKCCEVEEDMECEGEGGAVKGAESGW